MAAATVVTKATSNYHPGTDHPPARVVALKILARTTCWYKRVFFSQITSSDSSFRHGIRKCRSLACAGYNLGPYNTQKASLPVKVGHLLFGESHRCRAPPDSVEHSSSERWMSAAMSTACLYSRKSGREGKASGNKPTTSYGCASIQRIRYRRAKMSSAPAHSCPSYSHSAWWPGQVSLGLKRL
ncbi:hypothetical protein BJX68DRAFT_118773 [Aspergillus pseudodeflectus]|uniref:Uncharacterized protein n=1 Tax=Aspergillus pseudodeflectus TaxID=176178 RepID=A0ABR4L5H1_9EURO